MYSRGQQLKCGEHVASYTLYQNKKKFKNVILCRLGGGGERETRRERKGRTENKERKTQGKSLCDSIHVALAAAEVEHTKNRNGARGGGAN